MCFIFNLLWNCRVLKQFLFVRKRRNESKIVTVRMYPMKPVLIMLSVSHKPWRCIVLCEVHVWS